MAKRIALVADECGVEAQAHRSTATLHALVIRLAELFSRIHLTDASHAAFRDRPVRERIFGRVHASFAIAFGNWGRRLLGKVCSSQFAVRPLPPRSLAAREQLAMPVRHERHVVGNVEFRPELAQRSFCGQLRIVFWNVSK